MKFKFNLKRFLGVLFFWVGITFMLNSFSGITGYSIVEEIAKPTSSIFGFVFIIVGLVLFLYQQGKEKAGGGLEKKINIIRTKKFEKSIKKKPIKEIENALKKLGTGLANEEYLKHEDKWSIRIDKGARILYDRNGDEIVLYEFVPSSKHY